MRPYSWTIAHRKRRNAAIDSIAESGPYDTRISDLRNIASEGLVPVHGNLRPEFICEMCGIAMGERGKAVSLAGGGFASICVVCHNVIVRRRRNITTHQLHHDAALLTRHTQLRRSRL